MAKRSGDYYLRQAEKAGMEVKSGKGDHFKVYAPDHSSMMVVPLNLKGNGTEHSIIKWFLKFGVVLAFIFGVVSLFMSKCGNLVYRPSN